MILMEEMKLTLFLFLNNKQEIANYNFYLYIEFIIFSIFNLDNIY